jgi:hypothetical protein
MRGIKMNNFDNISVILRNHINKHVRIYLYAYDVEGIVKDVNEQFVELSVSRKKMFIKLNSINAVRRI